MDDRNKDEQESSVIKAAEHLESFQWDNDEYDQL